jgi:probable phosphoglycerate mutase
MTTFMFVRHAETEANIQQVWQGSLDAPLTARGMRQVAATARRVAELAKSYPIDRFYVSPLPRARSTAAAIAAAIRMQPVVEPGLREFDLGEWEGRSFHELRETEDLWNHWAKDPAFAPPSGESPLTFAARLNADFSRLAAEHPDETVLLVTHGGVISNLLAQWLGDGPHDWRRWEAHNCAISIIDQDQAGRWRPILINDISHLPPDARVAEDTTVWEVAKA